VQDDGAVVPLTATNVHLAPAGFATGFTLAGHVWLFTRDDSGRVKTTRDGAPPTLAMLDHARAPVASGSVFSGGGIVFAKMSGAPRAGVSAGGRVRVVGEGAIGTASPGDDVAVDASVALEGETAIAVRAIAMPSGFKGVGLVLDATGPALRASLRAWADAGKGSELASPIEVPAAAREVVRVVVKGNKLEAHVGTVALKADVPPPFAHGDVALWAKRGSSLEATGWTVKRP
jgi:hypothetical protein